MVTSGWNSGFTPDGVKARARCEWRACMCNNLISTMKTQPAPCTQQDQLSHQLQPPTTGRGYISVHKYVAHRSTSSTRGLRGKFTFSTQSTYVRLVGCGAGGLGRDTSMLSFFFFVNHHHHRWRREPEKNFWILVLDQLNTVPLLPLQRTESPYRGSPNVVRKNVEFSFQHIQAQSKTQGEPQRRAENEMYKLEDPGGAYNKPQPPTTPETVRLFVSAAVVVPDIKR